MKVIVHHPRIVGGKLYVKAAHEQEIHDDHADHWFVKALIASGDFQVVALEQPKEELKPKAEPQTKKKKSQ